MEIDILRLRQDLLDYLGTAMQFYQVALIDLIEIERATDDELIQIAINNNFDLSDYKSYQKIIK